MGVALRLGELHLIHTLTDIPMHVCSTFIHGRKLEGVFVIGQSGVNLQVMDGPERAFE